MLNRHDRVTGVNFECWQTHLNGMHGTVTEVRPDTMQRFVDGMRTVPIPCYGVLWDDGEHGIYTSEYLEIMGK